MGGLGQEGQGGSASLELGLRDKGSAGFLGKEGEGGAFGQVREGVFVQLKEGGSVEEGEGDSVKEGEGGSVEEGEGGVASPGGGVGSSGQVGPVEEGEGGTGSRQLGMRERVREHFRIMRRAMDGDFVSRAGERVVHWDGPSVRPKVSPLQEILQELTVIVGACDDGFIVCGKVAVLKDGDEKLVGRRKVMLLVFGGGRRV